MQNPSTFFKSLVTLIAIFFIALNTFFFLYDQEAAPCGCNMADRPTIGNPEAQVHVVLYEDILCPECIRFSNAIFPLIDKQYIATGKVQFTVVPITITGVSEEITHRLNCLHHSSPNSFWLTMRDVFAALEHKGDYDFSSLSPCMHPEHHAEITQNTKHATHLMGRSLMAPSFFVNGKSIGPYTYTDLVNAIEKELNK